MRHVLFFCMKLLQEAQQWMFSYSGRFISTATTALTVVTPNRRQRKRATGALLERPAPYIHFSPLDILLHFLILYQSALDIFSTETTKLVWSSVLNAESFFLIF